MTVTVTVTVDRRVCDRRVTKCFSTIIKMTRVTKEIGSTLGKGRCLK